MPFVPLLSWSMIHWSAVELKWFCLTAAPRRWSSANDAAHISIPTSTCQSDRGQQKLDVCSMSTSLSKAGHRCSCSALKRTLVRGPASRSFLMQLHGHVGKRKISDVSIYKPWRPVPVQFSNWGWKLQMSSGTNKVERESGAPAVQMATLGNHWTGEKVWAGFTLWFAEWCH